ncbi:uncharacterized protein [Triticum aestivum]|uniref:uncharacterized protein n=1 Tax=Triticum aestivum TaxID=4565 RepID=UPI001D02329D|nr:uncharacterized protein LOC123157550 [Triticum aestivum]
MPWLSTVFEMLGSSAGSRGVERWCWKGGGGSAGDARHWSATAAELAGDEEDGLPSSIAALASSLLRLAAAPRNQEPTSPSPARLCSPASPATDGAVPSRPARAAAQPRARHVPARRRGRPWHQPPLPPGVYEHGLGGAPAHRHPGEDGQFLLLHSAAYGHYLAATDVPAPPGHRGLRVEQRDYYHPEVEPLVWHAILSESEEEVYLRHIGGACLRANGRYWNTDASVDYIEDLDNISRKMLWVMEQIPAREVMPPLPRPIGLPHPMLRSRMIMYMWRNILGGLITRGSFVFWGRSVFRLRNHLVRRLRPMIDLDDSELVMGLPTRDGRMFPLVVDLPSSGHTLHIFLTIIGTPAHEELRYADVAAE